MVSNEVKKLEYENHVLRQALEEIQEKMNKNEVAKPKSCQYCKYYVQHYAKGGFPAYTKEYIEINSGHCTRGVPIKKGGKRNTVPDDTCQYFEIGTQKMHMGLDFRKED